MIRTMISLQPNRKLFSWALEFLTLEHHVLEGTYRFSRLKVLGDLRVDLFNIQKEKMH